MPESILILNAGSSSVKFSIFENDPSLARLVRGQIDGLNATARFRATDAEGKTLADEAWGGAEGADHAGAIEFLLDWCGRGGLPASRLIAAGHRVVHGGADFTRPERVDAGVISRLEALIPLAPLHQPHGVAAIKAVARLAPLLPQVACFDTAFHAAQPRIARMFAIPRAYIDAGVKRYGFHGLSYEHLARTLPGLDAGAAAGRTIGAHLGSGASLCAMAQGKSVATTMGLSALDGLVMSTRCGAIDPGVIFFLARRANKSLDEILRMLHEESGLLGVSGISADMRTLLASADPRAAEAVELFVYRAAREIGSMAAALQGLDALVFTGGIGENSAAVRGAICRACAWLGVRVDEGANEAGGPRIHAEDSRVRVWVVPADEERMIARHTIELLNPARA